MLRLALTLLAFWIVLYSFSFVREDFTASDRKRTIIGQARTVQTSLLTRAFPNIVPLRKQPPAWIVNVPLTPFVAPLKQQSQTTGPLPPFLLYKPQYLSKVQEQGDCGCCFAFAVGHTLSDRLAIATRGLFRDNISVQQLVSCYDTNSCEGGSPEDLCFWLSDSKTKVNTVYKFPYKQKSGGVIETKCASENGLRVGVVPGSVRSLVEFIEEEGYDVEVLKRNVDNMKRELYNDGPFYCAMTVYDDLFSYGGLQPYIPSKHATLVGGHAIEVIGYCEANVDPRKSFQEAYWICRNSWGTKWPRKAVMTGYFTIPMGRNMCGIESRCGSVTPSLEGGTEGGKVGVGNIEMKYKDVHEYVQ
jgi:Papain family cysteine protease